MFDYATNGLGLADAALLFNRVTLGAFYFLARFRFFYDPSRAQRWLNTDRHYSLYAKVKHCGFTRAPYFWAWIVALIEVVGALMLIAGAFAPVAAGALFILTAFATKCTAREKVMEQKPCDMLDCASCYLWRVEGLYLVMAAAVIVGGPGLWSLT